MSEPSRLEPPGAWCAWESAFASHYVRLCEYVLRFVGSAEVAEDLVQDLFLELWDSRGPHDADRLNAAYLHVAARNRALKYLRHQGVAAAWIERVARDDLPVADSPEDAYLARELTAAVQNAIARLPRACRQVFLLRRRDHLGYGEIAARLGLSLGTVKSQMWRATVRLKDELAPYLAHNDPGIPRPGLKAI